MACYLRHQEELGGYKSALAAERRLHYVEVQKLVMELENVRQEMVSHLHMQTTQYHCFPLLPCVYRKLFSLQQPGKCILRNNFKECVVRVCCVCGCMQLIFMGLAFVTAQEITTS
jgi:hypothetical protein